MVSSPRWSRERVVAEILRLYSQSEPLHYSRMERERLDLLRAAMRLFGSWQHAVEAAGLDYELIRRYRTWSRSRVIHRIRRYAAAGADLSWRHVATCLDPPLAAAALRPGRFATWSEALEAAGLDADAVRRHQRWDEQRIQDRIRDRRERGMSLRPAEVVREEPALLAAARRRYAAWDEALSGAV